MTICLMSRADEGPSKVFLDFTVLGKRSASNVTYEDALQVLNRTRLSCPS